MSKLRRILVPTDFSEGANAALGYALSLARAVGAEVEVLHVLDPSGYFLQIPPSGMPSTGEYDLGGIALEDAKLALAASVDLHGDLGVHVEQRVEIGAPTERILQRAKDSGCDLVIIGTHGRRGLARMLLGSVAAEVVKRATCPVLTWRPVSASVPAEERRVR